MKNKTWAEAIKHIKDLRNTALRFVKIDGDCQCKDCIFARKILKRTEQYEIKTTPRKFAATMRKLNENGDNEGKHGAMDDEMCRLLEELGYSAGVKIFQSADKWYA